MNNCIYIEDNNICIECGTDVIYIDRDNVEEPIDLETILEKIKNKSIKCDIINPS